MQANAKQTLAAPRGVPEITQTDLEQITVQDLRLGMDKQQAKLILSQQFGGARGTEPAVSAAFKCHQQQCQAQRFSAELSAALTVHFNKDDKIYWVTLNTQAHLAASPEECLRVAAEQLNDLRQQYSPADQRYFYGANTVTLRLNKHGHPDPVDNSLFGYRVQIKCDPFAKGLAQTEFELRDNAL